jgi:glycosyltransferase involved in cell wall biosynthesis
MLNSNSIISVIMSVYNHQYYVADAIESIINQTFKNLEFIIINDGSTDDSLDIIRKYERLDSRIFVINQDNIGLTRSLNVGIKNSSGQYIARQDADDRSALNRLEKQLDVLKKFELDIVTSRVFKGDKIAPHKFIFNFNQSDILKTGNIFIHGTFLMDRRIFDTQMYDETYRYAQDFKFILDALSNNFRIGAMLEPLYYLSNIETSISNTKKSEQDEYVMTALTTHFGDSKFYLHINNCNRYFKNICKLLFILYLHTKHKNYEFKIIREG